MEQCHGGISYKFEDFSLRESVWENIEKITSDSEERSQVKKAVGESIVDETLDLHSEVATLYEIWKEYHEEVNNIVCPNLLPEPPMMRENLEKQLGVLMVLLQEKMARQGGRPISTVLTDEEKSLMKTVSNGATRKKQFNQQSACSDPLSSGRTSRCSSSLSVDVDILEDNINVVEIDKIVQPLREDFEDERKRLLQDIKYIQDALIYESDKANRKSKQPSPTLTDLRRLSCKLEKEVLLDDNFKPDGTTLSFERNEISDAETFVRRRSSAKSPKTMSPSPPSTACTATFRRNYGTSPLNSPGKLIAARTFSLPLNDTEMKDDKSFLHRKKITPSPPSVENNSVKVRVEKFRKHVSSGVKS